jgi:hypothetical protein
MFDRLISTTTAAERAAAELDKIGARELQLLAEREEKRAALSRAQEESALAFLDTSKASIGRIVRLKTEVETIGDAIRGCRTRRRTALQNLLVARVSELRDDADRKEKQASAIEEKSGELLAALARLQGASYAPEAETASERLRREVNDARHRAAEMERNGVPNHGKVDVEVMGTPEVLAALLKHPGIVPPLEDVQRWAEACQASALKLRPDAEFGDLPRRVYLVWNRGEIDQQQSYIFVRELGKQVVEHPALTKQRFLPDDRPGDHMPYSGPSETVVVEPARTEVWYDTAQATFRAA